MTKEERIALLGRIRSRVCDSSAEEEATRTPLPVCAASLDESFFGLVEQELALRFDIEIPLSTMDERCLAILCAPFGSPLNADADDAALKLSANGASCFLRLADDGLLVIAVLPRPPQSCRHHSPDEVEHCVLTFYHRQQHGATETEDNSTADGDDATGTPVNPATPGPSTAVQSSVPAFEHRVHFFSCRLSDILSQNPNAELAESPAVRMDLRLKPDDTVGGIDNVTSSSYEPAHFARQPSDTSSNDVFTSEHSTTYRSLASGSPRLDELLAMHRTSVAAMLGAVFITTFYARLQLHLPVAPSIFRRVLEWCATKELDVDTTTLSASLQAAQANIDKDALANSIKARFAAILHAHFFTVPCDQLYFAQTASNLKPWLANLMRSAEPPLMLFPNGPAYAVFSDKHGLPGATVASSSSLTASMFASAWRTAIISTPQQTPTESLVGATSARGGRDHDGADNDEGEFSDNISFEGDSDDDNGDADGRGKKYLDNIDGMSATDMDGDDDENELFGVAGGTPTLTPLFLTLECTVRRQNKASDYASIPVTTLLATASDLALAAGQESAAGFSKALEDGQLAVTLHLIAQVIPPLSKTRVQLPMTATAVKPAAKSAPYAPSESGIFSYKNALIFFLVFFNLFWFQILFPRAASRAIEATPTMIPMRTIQHWLCQQRNPTLSIPTPRVMRSTTVHPCFPPFPRTASATPSRQARPNWRRAWSRR
jgi:hypothetical protein